MEEENKNLDSETQQLIDRDKIRIENINLNAKSKAAVSEGLSSRNLPTIEALKYCELMLLVGKKLRKGLHKGRDLWCSLFVFWNVVLSLLALALLITAEFQTKYRLTLLGLGGTTFLLAVLATHGVGGHWRNGSRGWQFFQPFRGGVPFVLTQALAWSLFGLTLLPWAAPIVIISVATAHRRSMDHGGCQWVDFSNEIESQSFWPPGLLMTAGVCGFLSETLVALSLWLFSSTSSVSDATTMSTEKLKTPKFHSDQALSKSDVTSDSSSLALKKFSKPTSDQNQMDLRPESSTHSESLDSVAKEADSREISNTLVLCPPSGGVLIQDLDDHPVSLPHIPQMENIVTSFSQKLNKCTAIHSSAVVEPFHWTANQKKIAKVGPWRVPSASLFDYFWWIRVRVQSLVMFSLIYCNHIFLILLIVSPFVGLPTKWAITAMCIMSVIYWPTYWSNPEESGRRMWKAIQGPVSRWLEEASLLHFGGILIVRESKDPLPPSGRYIFGFHPHGLFPAFISWIHLTSSWRTLFPGVQPVGLGASVIFRVPILRDLNLWAGMRKVSRKVFRKALMEQRSVILCPGGQSELAHHVTQHRKRVTLCARHKGFVRMAIETGSSLVPIFSFGESQLFDNLISWPSVQRYTYKRIGFPFPFLPFGFLGFLPLPRGRPVVLVVGEPIAPLRTTEVPTVEEVDLLWERYFSAIREIYDTHKARFGYEEIELGFEL